LSRRGLVRVLQLEMIESKQQQQQQQSSPPKGDDASDDFSSSSKNKLPGSSSSRRHLLETTTITTDDTATTATATTTTTKFQLRKELQLHLYISDSPCGDGSIYSVVDDKKDHDKDDNNDNNNNGGVQYTGAKVIVSQDTRVDSTNCGGAHQLLDGTNVAREEVQLLGKLRTKSGRSNLPAHLRSTSMSCSDKIVQWSILGLQGGLLSENIVDPIRLTRVVVSRDPRVLEDAQLVALERAIPMRVQAVWDHCLAADDHEHGRDRDHGMLLIPSVHVVVSQVFDSGKAATAARSAKQQRQAADNNNATTVQANNNNNNTPNEGKTSTKRKRGGNGPTISPCGFALNWQQSESRSSSSCCCTTTSNTSTSSSTPTEILVGARGIRQGKKPKSLEDYQKLASRLSRSELLQRQQQLQHVLLVSSKGDDDDDEQQQQQPYYLDIAAAVATAATQTQTTYQEFKSHYCSKKWRELKSNIIFKGRGPLVGWLVDKEDFAISISSDRRMR
jgi:hypothetical protein